MQGNSYSDGLEELANINKYAMGELTKEEKEFVEKANKIAEKFRMIKRRTRTFMCSNEIREVKTIWQRHHYLKPFPSKPNLEKERPELFKNRIAFIIWTVWLSSHLGSEEKVAFWSLEVAKILKGHTPFFSETIKEKAVKLFLKNVGWGDITETEKGMQFWENEIFPFLEGKQEFRWEVKEG